MNVRIFKLIFSSWLFCFPGSSLLLNASDRLPTNVTILTREDFAGANFTTVADVVDSLLSIDVSREAARGAQTTVKVRGGSSKKRTLVLLDGIAVNAEFDQEVDLNQFSLAIVERIEITRGGSSVAYGAEGIGGTIHIITSRPQNKGVDAELGTGVGRDGVRNIDGQIFGRSHLGDITYLASADYASGFTFNENLETRTHFGNMSRSFNGKGFWAAEFFFQEGEVGVPNGTPVSMDLWNGRLEREPNTPYRQREQKSQHIKAMLASPLIMGGTFYATAIQRQRNVYERLYRDGPTFEEHKNRTTIFELSWKRNGFEVGGERQDLKREEQKDPSTRTDQTSGYALFKWQTDQFTAVPGVRYDDSDLSGSITSPRLALIYQPFDQLLISGSANHTFRNPTFLELQYSTGGTPNTNLDPEKAWNYDLGFQWTPLKNFKMGWTGYFSQVNNVILLNESADQNQNYGTEENSGSEAEISFQLGENTKYLHLEFKGLWTYQHSLLNSKNGLGLVPAPLVPDHIVKAQLTHHLPTRMTLTNEIRYQSDQYLEPDHKGVEIPGTYLWNIRFQMRVLRSILYFEVENVTQRRYADTAIVYIQDGSTTSLSSLPPQPTRAYYAGISIKFSN
jgi:outer membrane cobalamin receptor